MLALCLLVQAAVAVAPVEASKAAPLAAASKTALIKTAEDPSASNATSAEPAPAAAEPAAVTVEASTAADANAVANATVRAVHAQSAAEGALEVVKQHWVTTAQETTGAKHAASQITDISGQLLNKYGKPEEPEPAPPKPVSVAGTVAALVVGLLVA